MSEPLFLMMFSVLGNILKKHEIFNSIIGFYTVDMVNNLGLFKVSSNVFFHYKTMLPYIFSVSFIGMVLAINKDISIFVEILSSSPMRVLLKIRLPIFYKLFYRFFTPFLSREIFDSAFFRTKFSSSMLHFKCFFAKWTYSFSVSWNRSIAFLGTVFSCSIKRFPDDKTFIARITFYCVNFISRKFSSRISCNHNISYVEVMYGA